MAEPEVQIQGENPPVPQPEVIDLDAEPDKVYLETSKLWARKDRVPETVSAKYSRILHVVATKMRAGEDTKRELEDYSKAAAKANRDVLHDRHVHSWGPMLETACEELEKELKCAQRMLGRVERPEDVQDLGRVVYRAQLRYDKACEGQDKAKALIKDLTTFSQAVRLG